MSYGFAQSFSEQSEHPKLWELLLRQFILKKIKL